MHAHPQLPLRHTASARDVVGTVTTIQDHHRNFFPAPKPLRSQKSFRFSRMRKGLEVMPWAFMVASEVTDDAA